MATSSRTPARPAVKCPDWCTVTTEDHIADLDNQEGRCIHHSASNSFGWALSSVTTPDGQPVDPDLPVDVWDGSDFMDPDEATQVALSILQLVAVANVSLAESGHPAWCNKKHQPGANPRRQSHANHWHGRPSPYLRTSAEFFCFPSSARPNDWPGAFMDLALTGRSGRTSVRTVLHVEELRSLAQRMLEMAAAAEAMPRLGEDARP